MKEYFDVKPDTKVNTINCRYSLIDDLHPLRHYAECNNALARQEVTIKRTAYQMIMNDAVIKHK